MRVIQQTLLLVLLLYVSCLGVHVKGQGTVTHDPLVISGGGTGETGDPGREYKALKTMAVEAAHVAAHLSFSATRAEAVAKEAEAKAAEKPDTNAADEIKRLEAAAKAQGASEAEKDAYVAAMAKAYHSLPKAADARAAASEARALADAAWAEADEAWEAWARAHSEMRIDPAEETNHGQNPVTEEEPISQDRVEAPTQGERTLEDPNKVAEITLGEQTKGDVEALKPILKSPRTEEELKAERESAPKEAGVKDQAEKTSSEGPEQGAREGKATPQKDTGHQANTHKPLGSGSSTHTEVSKGPVTITSTDDSSGADPTPPPSKGQGEARDSGHPSPVKPRPSDGAQETRDTVGPTSSGETPKDKTPVDKTDKGAKNNNPVKDTDAKTGKVTGKHRLKRSQRQ